MQNEFLSFSLNVNTSAFYVTIDTHVLDFARHLAWVEIKTESFIACTINAFILIDTHSSLLFKKQQKNQRNLTTTPSRSDLQKFWHVYQ